MKLENLILVDTCIWVPFFNRPQSRTKQIVDELIDEDVYRTNPRFLKYPPTSSSTGTSFRANR